MTETKHYKQGTPVPCTGIYWCTVCKLPARHHKGELFPACKNMCGRGYWQLVEPEEAGEPSTP